ncbi:uncharacterized protein LOC119604656 [Lucilia sericata]|uniref:uncharacterized protein LOC119604656 n=1 Tax=Lucilia sericata TaxID=13632 RepID=UPI0018A856C7|nr:uncharacterized protein LOC119604656 [Lucilia sericata]
MSEKKTCPMYPVGGLTISGEPIPAAAISGRGESNATEIRASLAATPGQTNPRATGNQKPAGKEEGKPKSKICQNKAPPKKGCTKNGGEVPLSLTPSTSKAAQALTDENSANSPASGAAKAVNPVPVVSNSTANQISGTIATPPPASEGTANSISGSPAVPPVQPGDSKPSRHVTPARRAFIKRRAAEKIIDRLGKEPAESLSSDDLSSLNWAKSVLADQQILPLTSKDAPKRQRSEEETQGQSQQPESKKLKQHRSFDRSFSEVAKGHLVRAIIDRADSDCSISHAN